MARIRADRRLVELGLAQGADEASRFILAGEVWLGQERVKSAGDLIAPDADLQLRRPRNYVSRGGEKLAGALDALGIDVGGRVCTDVGCSTGGFTDCLLRRGAAHVFAVDVGYGQFDWQLRNDSRVTLLERTNVRSLEPSLLQPRPDFLVADLSFIALRSVLAVLVDLIGGRGDLLLLVKPQFELPAADVRGGVVRDPALHARAVGLVAQQASRLGLEEVARVDSVLLGPKGNREIFLSLRAVRPRDEAAGVRT